MCVLMCVWLLMCVLMCVCVDVVCVLMLCVCVMCVGGERVSWCERQHDHTMAKKGEKSNRSPPDNVLHTMAK